MFFPAKHAVLVNTFLKTLEKRKVRSDLFFVVVEKPRENGAKLSAGGWSRGRSTDRAEWCRSNWLGMEMLSAQAALGCVHLGRIGRVVFVRDRAPQSTPQSASSATVSG